MRPWRRPEWRAVGRGIHVGQILLRSPTATSRMLPAFHRPSALVLIQSQPLPLPLGPALACTIVCAFIGFAAGIAASVTSGGVAGVLAWALLGALTGAGLG